MLLSLSGKETLLNTTAFIWAAKGIQDFKIYLTVNSHLLNQLQRNRKFRQIWQRLLNGTMWKVKSKVLPHRRQNFPFVFSSLQASFSALTFYQTSALAANCIPSSRHAFYQPCDPALSITPAWLCSSSCALFTLSGMGLPFSLLHG